MEDAGQFPFYLYKYIPVTQTSLRIITDSTLWFARPSTFNDPFDCSPVFHPEYVQQFWDARKKDIASQHSVTVEQLELEKAVMQQRLQADIDSGDFGKKLVDGVGIFCMSRNPCVELMWAHYADEYKGIVVELEISEDVISREFVPFQVFYSNIRPVVEYGNGKPNVEYYFQRKNRHWEYEQEERFIWQHHGAVTYPRDSMLSRVILGPNISVQDRTNVEAVIKQASQEIGRQIPIDQAVLSKNYYRIYIPSHPNPDFQSDDPPA